jgi:hypothetical protein
VSETRVTLRRALDELLQLLDHEIDDLLLLFVDQKVSHDGLIFVLQLEENVG